MIALIWQHAWNDLGSKLAERLKAAGYEVSVYIKNGQYGRQGELKDIEGAEIVLTLLSSSQEVEEVYLGSGGVFQNAAPSSLFIDLSTSNPRLAKELHALAAVHDHSFVEAPVEGSFDMFETGSFRVYVAGEPDNIKRALPILQALTPDVYEVGLPGNGSILKLASQIALANTMMGIVEFVTFSLVAGIKDDDILRILATNSSASALALAFGKKIIDDEFIYGVDLQQFFYDLTAALDAADEYGLALPGLETAYQLYDLLVLVGGSKKGIHALALIYCDEDRCTKHGLNWELAQQAMDVYERANEGAYSDYDYEDDDECDDPDCGHHLHHYHDYDDDGPPAMSKYFSPN